MRKIVMVGFLLLVPPVSANNGTTLLTTAYQIAKQDGISDPKILQGILIVESTAGQNNVVSHGNYGVMQVRLQTARFVVKKYGMGSTKNLNSRLMDPTFNIQVASKYMLYLQQTFHYKNHKLVAAYNHGPAGSGVRNPMKLAYVKKVYRGADSPLAQRARERADIETAFENEQDA